MDSIYVVYLMYAMEFDAGESLESVGGFVLGWIVEGRDGGRVRVLVGEVGEVVSFGGRGSWEKLGRGGGETELGECYVGI